MSEFQNEKCSDHFLLHNILKIFYSFRAFEIDALIKAWTEILLFAQVRSSLFNITKVDTLDAIVNYVDGRFKYKLSFKSGATLGTLSTMKAC